MAERGLSALQVRVLGVLAGIEPRWTLTGGGALAGVYLGHRRTRDLDLFWRGLSVLPDLEPVRRALEQEGLRVEVLRRTPGFTVLRVSDGVEVTVVDLVADPIPAVEAPRAVTLAGVEVQVDTPYEILVNKLNALLSRSELRDLVDLRALLATGADLRGALTDAERKDGGFSAATLGWVLLELPIPALVRAAGLPEGEALELIAFRDQLCRELAALSRPTRSGSEA